MIRLGQVTEWSWLQERLHLEEKSAHWITAFWNLLVTVCITWLQMKNNVEQLEYWES